MAVKQRSKQVLKKDHLKERKYQDLVQNCSLAGYQVRRERLKTGPGWRVLSGSCHLHGDKFIFIDSVLPQDEQIEFLQSKIKELGISASGF